MTTLAHVEERSPALFPLLDSTRITCFVFASAWILGLWPAAAEMIEYERVAISGGALWRGLLGHLAHYSWSHLAWDTLGFVALGAVCERTNRRTFAWAVGLSALAISVGLYFALPELGHYRGLSGVTSALFGLLAVQVVRAHWRSGRCGVAVLSVALCLSFVAVLVRSWLAAESLLVEGLGGQVAPVPLSHAIGLGIGVALALKR